MKKTTSESAVADETSVKCEAVENCIIPVDLVIKSSDGKRIGAHKKNLEQFCTGFPLADSVVHRIDDVVTLTETAETLLLLLKYTHYAQHDMTDFLYSSQDQLISLTAAADKYGNFFALQACATTLNKVALRSRNEALAVLPSLVLTGDLDHIDEIVRATFHTPLDDVFAQLKSHQDIFVVYALYKDRWHRSMTEFQAIVDDCVYLSAKYEDKPKGKAARHFRQQILNCPVLNYPSVSVADSATSAQFPNVFGVDDSVIDDWKTNIYDTVILGLPCWEMIAKDCKGK